MSLGTYLGEVYRIVEELRDEVPDDDVDAICRLGYESLKKQSQPKDKPADVCTLSICSPMAT